MKKTLIVICALYFLFTSCMLIFLNTKLDTVQASCNQLQDQYIGLSMRLREYDAQSVTLTEEEVRILQHNLEILNEFSAQPYYNSLLLAKECHTLKRSGKMESSWISSVQIHTTPVHHTEIVTNDGEHYWFQFDNSSGDGFSSIFKGVNRETTLYIEIE